MKRPLILLAFSAIVLACAVTYTNASQSSSSILTYDVNRALNGDVALYDTHRNARCFMTHDDFYSIYEFGRREGLKAQYSHLIPLGIVVKYSGAKIIWGFEGIKSVNWLDAKEYANNYSPDGHTWRLLTKLESIAICNNYRKFLDTFQDYYPNHISFLGAYCRIRNWTSAMSNQTNSYNYNYVYTLNINLEEGKTIQRYSIDERERCNVYPVSSL